MFKPFKSFACPVCKSRVTWRKQRVLSRDWFDRKAPRIYEVPPECRDCHTLFDVNLKHEGLIVLGLTLLPGLFIVDVHAPIFWITLAAAVTSLVVGLVQPPFRLWLEGYRCPHCRYDLRARTGPRCLECGRDVPEHLRDSVG